ncbi:hypothetical protein [Stutzerimonas nitrititolerans]|uniref:hypothetical protein n=1 Tax=Stutzerimonas nitrititolerans TaxID=2482751 RepID=UPI0028A11F85|nr:hypothetical protein [Stutzerimonas nitrititolerans]
MAEDKPINWAYPFPGKGTEVDPLQYLTHMAKAKGGYYPTGENGLWHGGVHFDQGTAGAFDQSSVRCIADGEVIAYRIDESYPLSEFVDEVPRINRAAFSTGFVLVKHSLHPPLPANAAGASSSEQTPPVLTLYSLYMHLQDWAGYRAKPHLPRPVFWGGDTYVVDTQGDDLIVRSQPSRSGAEVTRLANGTQVRIGIRDGEYCKLVAVPSGTTNPALVAGEDGELPGYLASKYLKAQKEPEATDQVVMLEQGIPIKAGELIGHPGIYQNHNSAAQSLVHLEVFSCDDVPGFIGRSRAWASRLPDSQKTLLKVHKGASKLIAHRDDIKSDNPPKLSDSGSQIGVDLIIPQALLDGLPAANKIQVKTPVESSSTPSTTYWWRLDGLFADENGNPIDGWLAEQDLITTRHSPWEWLDFQWIEDTGTPLEMLAYTLNAKGLLDTDEQHNYRAQISRADGGPIITLAGLYEIVDDDKDGVLTGNEMRTALKKPWQAQVLAQLITRYESEWFWNKAKWDELDLLLAGGLGQKNAVWEEEKKRIEKLSWWESLAGSHGVSEDGRGWYIHPVGLIEKLRDRTHLLVSREALAAIMASASEEIIEKYLIPINRALSTFEINTPLRIAHFLAQVGHETGELKFSEELSSGTQYEGRSSLGNSQLGDGPRFKGRGLIQITGRANYSACETYLKTLPEYAALDITSSTENAEQLAENPELAALASGFYWARLKPKLNAVADADDLFWVSVYVNGWQVQENPFFPDRPREPNNMRHRSLMLRRAKSALGIML